MELKKFRGLNNVVSPERFGAAGYLDAADNVDIDDSGKVLTRLGVSLAQAGNYHSLWAEDDVCLVMSGNVLYRVAPDYSLTPLRTFLASRRMSYEKQQNTVYFSNGVETGRLYQGRALEWGVRLPKNQPVAAPTVGGLPVGRYQYALVYRRADGQESGANKAEVIELTDRGGIAFSQIEASTDPEVVDKCIYISGPNGETLFRALVIPNMVTSASYTGDGYDFTTRLETQFDNPPPPGDIVENYNGVMYVVQGSTAWHSAPYQLERFCYRDRWLQFPGTVTLFASVNDGIYVGTAEKVWFLSGDKPGSFKSKVVFDYGAIPMAFTKTTLGALKSMEEAEEGAGSGTAVMWASSRGTCFGMEGGVAINMTERSYGLPSAQRGSAIVRQARGYTQVLFSLEGTQVAAPNVYA